METSNRASGEETRTKAPAHGQRVLFVTRTLPQYRVAFFEKARERLAEEGVVLELAYGQPNPLDSLKRDTTDIDWGTRVRNRSVRLGNRELVWQPCLARSRAVDLVVVEQASRLMLNYLLLALQATGGVRVAFWGHGANLQRHRSSRLGERIKRIASRMPHWWFAYTDGSMDRVALLGFPRSRTTVLQNSVDTTSLQADLANLSPADASQFRERHDLGRGPVGVFIGGLYEDKRLRFLIGACARVSSLVPDFRLVVVGDGPDREVVDEASRTYPWLRYIGSQTGAEKTLALAVGNVFLMPGLAGLAVLDAFAAGLPVVTTEVEFHSPEVEYVRDGYNGVIAKDPDDLDAYAFAVARVLTDGAYRNHLAANCLAAASVYTLESMTERFTLGVLAALQAGPRFTPRCWPFVRSIAGVARG